MKIFLTAGEASGDKLGAALMDGFEKTCSDPVSYAGVGGPLMQQRGLTSLFPMDDLAVMGIGEILSQYFFLKRRIAETVDAILAEKPDVLITIDAPEFSLRVAKAVRAKSDIPIVHYVAPSVWAWRPKRADKMAAHVDHVLALLPFEPPYMEAAGMSCDFVGHPVVTDPIASSKAAEAVRTYYGIGDAPIVTVLPGSRKSEVKHLAPIFGQVVEQLSEHRPDLQFVLPTVPNVAGMVQNEVSKWSVKPIVLDPRELGAEKALSHKRAILRASDFALAASGTVSLELAANSTPMVIAYTMNWLSRQIIGRMLRVDTVTLVNLVAESRTVPEYIGKDCQPDLITAGLLDVIGNVQPQQEAMAKTMQRLGKDGLAPGERAAQSVLNFLGRRE